MKHTRAAWFLAAALLLVNVTGCAATEPESQKSNQLTDLKICAALTEGSCQANESALSVDSGAIYAAVTAHRAMDGTEATATLSRLDDGGRKKVLSYSLGIEPDEETGTAELVFFFDASANTGNSGRWEAGMYEVSVTVHAAGAETLTSGFELR